MGSACPNRVTRRNPVQSGDLGNMGGASYLHTPHGRTASAANAAHYPCIVAEPANRRKVAAGQLFVTQGKVYAKCIERQDEATRRRIEGAFDRAVDEAA
jgi:replicative DNA helicase